ncbi:hypothetical protein PISMIDRAFT_359240 [Pisolithus microcarpus 441]|uniref:Uncharacterized protein n=1 Tax=Pisolithus microcarpus 441 TaxID=765257 RepID=A0A0C9YVI0_9AGAM|nr:hypothetical protein PISMIDRAFT_359240 [Pisolithus microcarpus 441]
MPDGTSAKHCLMNTILLEGRALRLSACDTVDSIFKPAIAVSGWYSPSELELCATEVDRCNEESLGLFVLWVECWTPWCVVWNLHRRRSVNDRSSEGTSVLCWSQGKDSFFEVDDAGLCVETERGIVTWRC